MSEALLLEFRFAADPRWLATVRKRVQAVASALVADARWVSEVVMAVNEACANVIQHAYGERTDGEIVLEMRRAGAYLEIALVDFAEPVPPEAIQPRDLDELRPGGLGTYFIRTLMDRCEYGNLARGAGNILRMSKRLLGTAPPRAASSGEP